MKQVIIRQAFAVLLFLLTSGFLFANMASPVQQGTVVSPPFISQHVDILSEIIKIRLNKDFSSAFFEIEYRVRAKQGGKQIPLLFHANDYNEGFVVRLDGKEITLKNLPPGYFQSDTTGWEQFDQFLDKEKQVEIRWPDGYINKAYASALKYFETDLSAGLHTFTIEYSAIPWVDDSDWVKEYSFRYAMMPAKYWRTFGGLEIQIDASEFGKPLYTNLGEPRRGDLTKIATYNFDHLPVNDLHIYYKPTLTPFIKALIKLHPMGIALLCGFLMAILHGWLIHQHRRTSNAKFSWIVTIGALLIPLLSILIYMFSFGWIDTIIGPHAGGYHGYTFLIIVYYPLVMPVYWLAMWWIDRGARKQYSMV